MKLKCGAAPACHLQPYTQSDPGALFLQSKLHDVVTYLLTYLLIYFFRIRVLLGFIRVYFSEGDECSEA